MLQARRAPVSIEMIRAIPKHEWTEGSDRPAMQIASKTLGGGLIYAQTLQLLIL